MDWLNLIQNLGVPVAFAVIAALGCKYVYDKESDKAQKEMTASREERKEIEARTDKLTISVNDNTRTLSECVELLTKIYEDK